MAEFGVCHRNGPGALHGLMRVRSFTQDDAHVFCTEQIRMKCRSVFKVSMKPMKFGFEKIVVKLSARPKIRRQTIFGISLKKPCRCTSCQ